MEGEPRRGAGLLLLCAVLLPAVGLGVNRGQTGCPCVEWSGLDNYVTQRNGQPGLEVQPSGSGGSTHWYPSDYGTLECQTWDLTLPPYCADNNGVPKAAVPSWCRSEWCYVDPNDCNLPLTYRSSYFPNEEVYYSYATCGSANTFESWFTSGASASHHEIVELINVTASYVKATRDEIESAFLSQAQAGTGCSLTSGCSCGGCDWNEAWGQRVAFTDTMALTSNPLFTCLGMIVSDTYKRVAGREYNDASRIGYQYMAFQEDGSYLQWPGIEWCPASYDPRFRDWYAGPAAGPKDIVIVIDKSGSMGSHGRMGLARDAAKSVLRTLTWVDMVAVVAFSESAQASSSALAPATAANKERLEAWIDEISDGGGTNFIQALDMAMDLLISARSTRCFTSNCAGALLFLTDGQPDSWGGGDYSRLRSKNGAQHVKVFTYALGAGANHDILVRLAAEHQGEFRAVADGGALNNAMSSYYKVFAQQFINSEIVRWITYNEYITNEELLAGCLPLYDRRDPQSPSLMGVTCMDLNIIADLPTLRAIVGWQDFEDQMEADSRRCRPSDPGRVLTRECQGPWSTITTSGARGLRALARSAGILVAAGVSLLAAAALL